MIKLIIIGLMLGILNGFALKFTVNLILKYKSPAIAVLSLLIRMSILVAVLYCFLDAKWQNALYMLIGLTIAKMFFIIYEKITIKKYGNNTR